MLLLRPAAVAILSLFILISCSEPSQPPRSEEDIQATAVAAQATAEAANAEAIPPTATPLPYHLALISSSCTTDRFGYNTCSGFAQNVSNQTLRFVRVNIIWLDANGTPQQTDWTYLDYTTLLAGQQSGWETVNRANPALTRYRLEFEMDGRRLLIRDDRPQ